MKIAIISDVHSNLEALTSVVEDIKDKNIKNIYCLGDTIGYGINPLECWNIVKNLCVGVLQGNHEECLDDPLSLLRLNKFAAEGVRFSKNHLDDTAIKELSALPRKMVIDELGLSIAHGAFNDNPTWTYVIDYGSAKTAIAEMPTSICTVGHTHTPIIIKETGKGLKTFYNDLKSDRQSAIIVNVGSVGQPRDGNWHASYATINFEEDIHIQIHRVAYDIETTINKMKKEDVSDALYQRLRLGL